MFRIDEKNSTNGHFNFGRNYLENILKIFLIFRSKIFKLIFLESSAENIKNTTFFYSNMSSFYFFALVNTLNHNFCNKTTVWEKSIEALFNPEFKENYFTETCQIGKPTRPPFKIYFIQLMKKYFFRCAKISSFSVFFRNFKYSILT